MTWVAINELPPSSKKSSSAAFALRAPSTSAKIAGHDLLDGSRPACGTPGPSSTGCGQRLAIELAGSVERKLGQEDEGRRDHVGRAATRQIAHDAVDESMLWPAATMR